MTFTHGLKTYKVILTNDTIEIIGTKKITGSGLTLLQIRHFIRINAFVYADDYYVCQKIDQLIDEYETANRDSLTTE